MASHIRHRPRVDDDQCPRDSVDKIDTGEERGAVGFGRGHERHQGAADHAGDAAECEPGPAVGGSSDAVAYEEGGDYGDYA